MLYRIAWIQCAAPIEQQSPSPVFTNTFRSGRAILTPSASGNARPWMPWNP